MSLSTPFLLRKHVIRANGRLKGNWLLTVNVAVFPFWMPFASGPFLLNSVVRSCQSEKLSFVSHSEVVVHARALLIAHSSCRRRMRTGHCMLRLLWTHAHWKLHIRVVVNACAFQWSIINGIVLTLKHFQSLAN